MSSLYPMLPLDVRALIRNRFAVSKPTSKTYTFKKRIQPVISKKVKAFFMTTKNFTVVA